MAKSKLKQMLEHLPVFDEMPDCRNFRENPVRVYELALIKQKTNPNKGYYPHKIEDLSAVIGRSPKTEVIYFTPGLLTVPRKRFHAANDVYLYGRTHSIQIEDIESYETLKRLPQ